MTALTVLAVGATGSIGRLVVAEALAEGHTVRALVRSSSRTRELPGGAEVVVGDLTRRDTLADAVAGVDAVVFTHGSGGGGSTVEAVDYGGVREVLAALGSQPARIALMTAIGVTYREGSYNRSTGAHDWKRRSERLVRVSGRLYTVVRPGWFDDNAADELRLVGLQGDTRRAGNSTDGVVSRRQIAEVLVRSLTTPEADRRTFELVAEQGPATTDFAAFFGALAPDGDAGLDGVRDAANLPIDAEPQQVRQDLAAVTRPHH
ncbi:MAG TPA: SDR family oxidoreductase [Friedmanniella sp.]